MIKLLGLPPLASEHGRDVDHLILYVHILMGLLFVGWLAYFLYTILRFSSRFNPKASYAGVQGHASTVVELGVVLVEAILLIGFAVPLWAKVADAFPAEANATVIRVIAKQFAWNTRYPGKDGKFGVQEFGRVKSDNPNGYVKDTDDWKDDFASNLNELFVPVGKPVIAHITSEDVIHSFKVNPFRITQDAIPGLSIPIHFTPNQEGTFLINCAQLCGNAHATMKGYVRVVSQARYDEWLNEQAKRAATGGAGGGFE